MRCRVYYFICVRFFFVTFCKKLSENFFSFVLFCKKVPKKLFGKTTFFMAYGVQPVIYLQLPSFKF